MASGGKSLNFVLLGKTGHGKSSTGNSILGREAFKESDNFILETEICTLECSMRDDTRIRVVDTPGLMDTINPIESILSELGQAMSLCQGGFHSIIFVLRYGIRFTEEENQVFVTLKKYFGGNILKTFGVIVMTQGDSFHMKYNKKRTFKEWLNEQKSTDRESPFVQLLNECNNRCVLFYNCGEIFEELQKESVREMFDLISRDIPKPYTSHHFENAKITRETLVKELRSPVLCAEIQEELSLLMDQLNRDMKNHVVSYDAMKYKIKEIEKELDKLNDDSKEFHFFKKQIDGLTENLKQIREMKKDKVKQKQQQELMMKDLETIKNPPSSFELSSAKFVYAFTKVFTNVCNIVTLGRFEDTFKSIKDGVKKYLDEIIKKIEEYRAARDRVPDGNCSELLLFSSIYK